MKRVSKNISPSYWSVPKKNTHLYTGRNTTQLPVYVTSPGDSFSGEKRATLHCDLSRLMADAASWKTHFLVTWSHWHWINHMPVDSAGAESLNKDYDSGARTRTPSPDGCLCCCWHEARSLPLQPMAKPVFYACDCCCVGYDFGASGVTETIPQRKIAFGFKSPPPPSLSLSLSLPLSVSLSMEVCFWLLGQ